jgi:steroid 5-alpha reductase family enzyme
MKNLAAIVFCVLGVALTSWLVGLPGLASLGGLALVVQWLAFVPAYLKQTEHFYDLTGSLTYVLLLGAAVGLADGVPDARGLLLVCMVGAWTIRLGSFLFRRVQRAGRDGRFDEIKPDPLRFAAAWTIQGVWVFLTGLAAWIAIVARTGTPLGWLDLVGFALWAFGWGVEIVADRQKSAFRARPGSAGHFIDEGLWSRSRHPNYAGEIVLWTGVCVVASSSFVTTGAWMGVISPIFVYLLLTRVSGIPLLETRADASWGGQADYEAYKTHTPMLWPWG